MPHDVYSLNVPFFFCIQDHRLLRDSRRHLFRRSSMQHALALVSNTQDQEVRWQLVHYANAIEMVCERTVALERQHVVWLYMSEGPFKQHFSFWLVFWQASAVVRAWSYRTSKIQTLPKRQSHLRRLRARQLCILPMAGHFFTQVIPSRVWGARQVDFAAARHSHSARAHAETNREKTCLPPIVSGWVWLTSNFVRIRRFHYAQRCPKGQFCVSFRFWWDFRTGEKLGLSRLNPIYFLQKSVVPSVYIPVPRRCVPSGRNCNDSSLKFRRLMSDFLGTRHPTINGWTNTHMHTFWYFFGFVQERLLLKCMPVHLCLQSCFKNNVVDSRNETKWRQARRRRKLGKYTQLEICDRSLYMCNSETQTLVFLRSNFFRYPIKFDQETVCLCKHVM